MRFNTVVHGGRGYSMMTAAELAAAGVPDDVIAAEMTRVVAAEAGAVIDAMCDAVYTTSPSRDARYNNKYAEAIAYRDAGWPGTVAEADYPTLYNEAPARGLTKRQLAELIIEKRDAFNLIGAKAEAARAALDAAIAGADGIDAKRAAAQAIVAAFQVVANGV